MPETKGPERGEVLSPDELAAYLRIGRTYTYRLLSEGKIRSFKISKLRRIRRADLEQYVNKQAHASHDG